MKNILIFAMFVIASSMVAAETVKTPFQNALNADGFKTGSYMLTGDITATISQHEGDSASQGSSWVISVTNPASKSTTAVMIEFYMSESEQAATASDTDGVVYEYHRMDIEKNSNDTLLIAVGSGTATSLPDAYTGSIEQDPTHWTEFDAREKYKSLKADDATESRLKVFLNTDASNLFANDKAELSTLALKRYEEIVLLKRYLAKVKHGMLCPKVGAKIIMNILVGFVKPAEVTPKNG